MDSRVVVLTGASSGIGRAAALAFAARGDKVVLAARGLADLEKVAAECGGDALVVPADVTVREEVDALARAALDRFGRIDVWADTAAVMVYGRFEDIPPHVFDRVVTADLLGPANVARAALRVFRAQGHGTLITASSLVGHITAPNMSAYSTAKWGLRALSRTLRQETRDAPDIHVCQLVPGSVDTPIYTSAANYAGFVGRPPPPVDSAERMGAAVVRLADRPRRELSVGATNRLIEFGFVAMPPVYDLLVGPLMGRLGLSQRRTPPSSGNVFASRPRVEGGPARFGRAAVGAAAAGAVALSGVAALALRRGAATPWRRAGGGAGVRRK
ncbi:SDR family NAD(P)-dependent oxidoreductase [Couchioplanes caeruleus]|uniref:SDR family NAD(P)-dependent oxidoreductase n=1 Tax=Couchioplanes caeruleus TaxID=56438 RepID=UPI0020BD5D22|nr:SDR family NAD(P)-dependent oxidoreductase [Couchioplanes caeruleus]UQU66425.1 SDR family NAD(P)-dependent oxidoreductase [Couchioplanes caeruleus]